MTSATIEANDRINKAFNEGEVVSYDIDQLQKLLVDFANIRESEVSNQRVIDVLPKRRDAVLTLIELKIKNGEAESREKQSRRTFIAALVAAIASLIAATATVFDLAESNPKGEP